MGRPERPIADAQCPVAGFALALRQLREDAGRPSYRSMAKQAHYTQSVLSSAANGRRLPTMEVALAFVRACGGGAAEWEQRWRSVDRLSRETAPPGELAHREAGARPLATSQQARLRPQTPRYGGLVPVQAVATPQWPVAADDRPGFGTVVPGGMVGRDAELKLAVEELVGRSTSSAPIPLVLSGVVGVGKTVLAEAVAAAVGRGRAQETLHVDLDLDLELDQAPEPTAEVIARYVLRALGVGHAEIPDEPLEALGLFRYTLTRKPVVLLLDSAVRESQVRPLLSHVGDSQVIVASRSRLLGLEGVRRRTVCPMSYLASLELLKSLVGHRLALREPAQASRLAWVCEGLPLALRIVAGQVMARGQASLSRVVADLEQDVQRIDRLTIGDVSVGELLGAACARVSAEQHHVLAQLAQSKDGRADAQALANACAMSRRQAEDTLESLLDAGLVSRGRPGGGYRLPRLVRCYVQHQDNPAAGHRKAGVS